MKQQMCDPNRLDQFLLNELSETEEQQFTRHLDECADCREELESRAAERSLWREASNLLGGANGRLATAVADHHGTADRSPQIEQIVGQLAATDDPESLGRIGGYEVTGVVGAGGMGVVLKAHDRSLDRVVAVKVMSPHLASSGAARKRFAREAKAVAAVLHPNVIAIHAVASDEVCPYLVMPYVRGASLQKRIDSQGPLPLKDTLRIAAQIAAGLAAAHEQGLVHRDIKPANILLEEGVERVTITDFGLARAVDDAAMTRSGVIAGTPQYMSPEQTRGGLIGARSDLFSLGSVLYAMCAGRSPFRAETTYGVLHRIANEKPTPICEVNSDVPVWLGHIIERLMAKCPDDRYESATEVAELFEGCLAHVQQPTMMPLPVGVQALAAQAQANAKGTVPSRLKSIHQRIPPAGKLLAAAVFGFSLIFAGVLIVVELNKGTLTIESEADDVPIRIKRGEDVAKITFRPGDDVATIPLTPQRHVAEAIREFNHLHPADAKGKPQPPLTQSELRAVLMWMQSNGELSDGLVLALRSSLDTRDRVLPAGWRFVGGLAYETCPDGVVQTWQIQLETNGLAKPIAIRRSAIAPPPDVRKPTEFPDESETSISLTSMIENFNAAHPEIDQRGSLPHELPPLTLDEVLAAVELSRAEYVMPSSKGPASTVLQRIVATHCLTLDARFELVSEIEDSIGQWYTVESIHLVVPRAEDPAKTERIKVRHQFVDGDVNHPKATHWSKPGRNGLQAGVRLVPAEHTYEHGDVVDIEFLYRSAIAQKVAATLPPTFQFGKVRGVRLERVSFVKPKWPDGSVHTLVGSDPLVLRGHRMQICFDSSETSKPGVNLKAMTRPEAAHYVRFTVPNPGDDATDEQLEIAQRLFFRIPPLTPPKVFPLFESHYYQHWGVSVPGHRLPEQSTPDPKYIDPFQIGVSLGPADASRIPAYYASGLEVTKVAPYGSAESAGIEVGDILLSWEGNLFYGDDPHRPLGNHNWPNNQLQEVLAKNAKSKGWGSSSMKFDLLDHHTGEVIRIAPWFGSTANGGPNKSEIIKRMTERKQLRDLSSFKE